MLAVIIFVVIFPSLSLMTMDCFLFFPGRDVHTPNVSSESEGS